MSQEKKLLWRRVDAGKLELTGMTVVIVGGTGGIGRAISRFLASRGAKVTVVGQTFRDADETRIMFIQADLNLMSEAHRVASMLPAETLDLLVFTTGIFAAPKRQETAEGIERDMAVSYLSRLIILRDIAPRLRKEHAIGARKPRVFIMGYPGTGQTGTLDDLNSEKSYSPMTAHMNTVAGNEMLVLDAVKRYPHATFFGLAPGLIKTNIRDNFYGGNTLRARLMEGFIGLFTPSADTYAKRIAPLLVSPDIEGHSGAMFDPKGLAISPSPKLTESYTKSYMTASEELVASATEQADPK